MIQSSKGKKLLEIKIKMKMTNMKKILKTTRKTSKITLRSWKLRRKILQRLTSLQPKETLYSIIIAEHCKASLKKAKE